MARGRALAGTARGGEGIPALRAARARLIAGLGSVGLAAALAAYPALAAGGAALLAEGLGGVAVVVLAGGLALRWPSTVPWALAFLGGAYAVLLERRGGMVDGWAAAYGPALLLVAELAYWSLERGAADPTLARRRAATLGLVLLAAAFADLVLLVAAGVAVTNSLLVLGAGLAAAAAVLALLATLARRAA